MSFFINNINKIYCLSDTNRNTPYKALNTEYNINKSNVTQETGGAKIIVEYKIINLVQTPKSLHLSQINIWIFLGSSLKIFV